MVLPPHKVKKYILDQNKGFWSHLDIIHFWNVFLFQDVLKSTWYQIAPQHAKIVLSMLINQYLVVILPRSVYTFFFRSKRGLLKPHGTYSLLKRFSGFNRVIFYIDTFTGMNNQNLARFYRFFFVLTKKIFLANFNGKSACNNCLKYFLTLKHG